MNTLVLMYTVQLAVVRQVLRKELGLKIVEVESDKALVEGGDVLWTGIYCSCLQVLLCSFCVVVYFVPDAYLLSLCLI